MSGRPIRCRPPSSVAAGRCRPYFVGEVQNNQETITYTVYNEQADPETGVLADRRRSRPA